LAARHDTTGPSTGLRVERSPFGALADGRPVDRYTLANASGMAVAILTYGGILQAVEVPDREGRIANVTLGLADLAGYTDPAYLAASPFFGALIGRYANRIARGRFTLDGSRFELPANDPPNHLHGGGAAGFDVQLWEARPFSGAEAVGLRLGHTSPAGEGGYPGTLAAAVTFSLRAANELRIDYEATTDAPTIVNLTSHAYWNLAGEGFGTIHEQLLQVRAARYTPVDDTRIPTGAVVPVAGTPMDFTRARAIGGGYDHNWVLDGGPGLAEAAVLADPGSGRVLRIATDQPGIQVYSGNFLDGTLRGPSGRPYPRGAGVALETQHFPDSPNRPEFPSTVLRPGETYRAATVLRFSTSR
jgi:aldose 1-epimerase